MNKAILKITKYMWTEIKEGRKKCDVRKLNKDYIQEGYIIDFVDVESGEYLGTRKIDGKKYCLSDEPIKHIPTYEFMLNNYSDEIRLIIFDLEEV